MYEALVGGLQYRVYREAKARRFLCEQPYGRLVSALAGFGTLYPLDRGAVLATLVTA